MILTIPNLSTDYLGGGLIGRDDFRELCALILREVVWCKFEHDESLYFHFGYDYYMYIGCNQPQPDSVEYVHEVGLHIETCASPYLI